MGELLTALFVAGFYATTGVLALILTESFLAFMGWLDDRNQKRRLDRIRRP